MLTPTWRTYFISWCCLTVRSVLVFASKRRCISKRVPVVEWVNVLVILCFQGTWTKTLNYSLFSLIFSQSRTVELFFILNHFLLLIIHNIHISFFLCVCIKYKYLNYIKYCVCVCVYVFISVCVFECMYVMWRRYISFKNYSKH